MLQNLHTHTTYCDGKDDVETMILAAIDLGLDRIGFSGHSYTWFDESYCMSKEGTRSYIREVRSLGDKYADRIEVLCGIEQDYYSKEPVDGYDFVIGSVHYIKVDGEFLPVDESLEITEAVVKRYFDGDYYAWTKCYFETVADVAGRTHSDIIGHLDLVTKFNENGELFDERDERYLGPAKLAIDKLLNFDIPFEVNTGAIARGFRSEAYPSAELRAYIIEHGGKLIYASDAHSAGSLLCAYDKFGQI